VAGSPSVTSLGAPLWLTLQHAEVVFLRSSRGRVIRPTGATASAQHARLKFPDAEMLQEQATKAQTSGAFSKEKRMMGFEPTAFCMASGSWIRGQRAPEAARLRRIASFCARCMLRADSRDLRSIQSGLGTGTAVVLNEFVAHRPLRARLVRSRSPKPSAPARTQRGSRRNGRPIR
jgi:hypothetical protein